ncbi:MFS transporter [Bacillus sp. DTU_2020_1000418_1_SI_GHA_SEK_038]|uniref:MFS transporter n=1 Tax=Bacillus sp. DTU_2020_1000418_1_SI_GHA_SEK_038 TaxID=3077585 RepID=UPI0028E3DA89|nr:MFS transporter [Bacillus sp. DTU_2020_1000418_1_SI_GHA_SEK_038]WNS75170.1 MFS transporter [Bacillus sp. DTU_2020_1000418_1_SI_GHA_SEK_038]
MAKEESLLSLKLHLFIFNATNTIIISFLPIYLKYKGLMSTEIGWVLATGLLASIFSQVFWGYISDKYKVVKRILLICTYGFLVSSFIFFQLTDVVAILMVGAVFYFFSTPIGALIDSLAQRKAIKNGVSFGSIRTWGSIGFAASSLIVGKILALIGIQHLIWPFLFLGFMTLFSTYRLKDVKAATDKVRLHNVQQLIKNKPLLIFLLLILLLSISHRTNDNFISLYIIQLGGSENLVGISWFIAVLSDAIIFAFAGFWYKKYHPMLFIIVAGVLYSLRWFTYSIINEPILIVSLQFLNGLTFACFYIAAFDYISRLIPSILKSTGHLLFYAIFFGLSGIIGSILGGILFDTFGGGTLYFVMGCLALVGTTLTTVHYTPSFRKNIESGI